MAAGLAGDGAVLETLAEIRQEVRGDDLDGARLASALDRCDRALERVAAAACGDEGVELRIRAHESLGSFRAALGGRACVLRVREFRLVVRMVRVPVLDAGLVAFPAAEPGRVALLPADEADVAAALVKEDLDEPLAVLYLVLMHSADVVRGLERLRVDVRVLVLVDDAEELRQVDAVVVGRLDGGSHLRVGRVADNDALAAGGDERLDGGRDLLRYMSLVDVDELYAERVRGLIEDALALGAEHIRRAPDGDADLHLVRRALLFRRLRTAAGERERAEHEHRDRT